jgi:hypothetical protein
MVDGSSGMVDGSVEFIDAPFFKLLLCKKIYNEGSKSRFRVRVREWLSFYADFSYTPVLK